MKRVKDTRTIVLDRNFQIAVACPRWVCLLVIPVCVCAYVRVRVFVKYFCLLNDFYFRSQSLQLLLELVRGLFLHVFLHDLRCRLDQFLCLLQPQTGDRPHLLDDLDLRLGVEAQEFHVKGRLFFHGFGRFGTALGDRPSGPSRGAELSREDRSSQELEDHRSQGVDLLFRERHDGVVQSLQLRGGEADADVFGGVCLGSGGVRKRAPIRGRRRHYRRGRQRREGRRGGSGADRPAPGRGSSAAPPQRGSGNCRIHVATRSGRAGTWDRCACVSPKGRWDGMWRGLVPFSPKDQAVRVRVVCTW
mmetsp:Transcript_118653/g.242526  ORF Transcript_118653/g.242526 Transcript_118653/m.242526 type:complete len:304 (+) Transcript_118653:1147-2058(+)